jgi:hypothetical protein
MSPNRPYAKVVSHGRYVAFQMAEVAIPRNWSPTSCGWSPNYDHRPLHPQRKAFDCHAFDGIRGKGASRLRQTQHFSELSEASARPDARPQGAAAIHACQERQSGINSA